ncbi:MAG: hypothetical protein ACOYOZ_17500, partial [Pirellula sp.]
MASIFHANSSDLQQETPKCERDWHRSTECLKNHFFLERPGGICGACELMLGWLSQVSVGSEAAFFESQKLP